MHYRDVYKRQESYVDCGSPIAYLKHHYILCPWFFLCDKNPGTLITLYILLHIMNITVGNGNSVLIDRNIYYRG